MDERHDRFRINTDEVAAKMIDGEAIIINLTTGVYYSMDGTGGQIWSLLEARRDVSFIVDALAPRYGVAETECRRDVEHLVDKLLAENLIVALDNEAGAEPDGEPVALPADPARDYAAPSLNIYRDMGDLLALDPPVPGLQPIPWDDPLEDGLGPAR